LIDPEKVGNEQDLRNLLDNIVSCGTDAILIGGSTAILESDVDRVVKVVEEFDIPSILFPGSVAGLSRYADAVLFISLLNSENPYFIVGAHVYAAPIIKRYGLEVLPTGYIIVGYGGSAGFMGYARPIPYEKPELVAAYALAAQYLGMRYVYLEAGSGAPKPVPLEAIKMCRSVLDPDVMLIVGGGIRDPETARNIARSGADIIVTGTVVEQDLDRACRIIKALKEG